MWHSKSLRDGICCGGGGVSLWEKCCCSKKLVADNAHWHTMALEMELSGWGSVSITGSELECFWLASSGFLPSLYLPPSTPLLSQTHSHLQSPCIVLCKLYTEACPSWLFSLELSLFLLGCLSGHVQPLFFNHAEVQSTSLCSQAKSQLQLMSQDPSSSTHNCTYI